MGRLSELLTLRDQLLTVDADAWEMHDSANMLKMLEILRHVRGLSTDLMTPLSQAISDKNEQARSLLLHMNSHVNSSIRSIEKDYLQENDRWCRQKLGLSAVEYQTFINDMYAHDQSHDSITTKHFKRRISQRSNWQHTCLLWHSDNIVNIEDYYACHIMYVMNRFIRDDIYGHVLDSINPAQRRKIRQYNYDDAPYLPKAGINEVAAKNYFTHMDRAEIKKDLLMIRELLVPGGILSFNFNDCNTVMGATLFESRMRSYMTEPMLKEVLREVNLEINYWEELQDCMTTYVEVRRPGRFHSMKSNITMGKILEKSTVNLC